MKIQIQVSKYLLTLSLISGFFIAPVVLAATRAPGSGGSSATSSPLQPIPQGTAPNVSGSIEYSAPSRPDDGNNQNAVRDEGVGQANGNSSKANKNGFITNGNTWLGLVGIVVVGILIFGFYKFFVKRNED